MKIALLAITLILVSCCPLARAASAEEEAKFVAAAKQAFEKHDADELVALTCWDRVPDKLKASDKEQYVSDVAQQVGNITLTNPDPNYPDPVWKDTEGISYQSNLPVVKQLKITFKTGELGDGTYPVGENNGKLYLLEPAPVKPAKQADMQTRIGTFSTVTSLMESDKNKIK